MIFGMTYFQICLYFLVYSFGGWVVEVIFHAVALGKVINRGFLNGPVCPVYGFGVLSVFAMLNTIQSGGHQMNDANDLLYKDNGYEWFNGRRIDNPNTHGTGCTLSSAIASNLAKGFDMRESVRRAKEYISGALAAMLDLGKGSGPMDHGFAIENEFTKEKGE